MQLKDKFEQRIEQHCNQSSRESHESAANACVDIAKEDAIGLLEWVDINFSMPFGNGKWYRYSDINNEIPFTTEQVYQEYQQYQNKKNNNG